MTNDFDEDFTALEEDFFDASFIAELEDLADSQATAPHAPAVGSDLGEKLAAFLAPLEGHPAALSEEEFVGLTGAAFDARTEALLLACRGGGKVGAVQAVENFIVFFQALVGTLRDGGARDVKRLFFRLAPILLHIAYNDFSDREDVRQEGRAALENLGRILTEIAGVRLTPTESELVFRSIDQMTGFISVGEYVVANDIISSQLLSIIERNKIARALYRLMEVEVAVQRYLKEKRGYPTPQVRIPDDDTALADYGPIRVLHEDSPDGNTRRFLQIQMPDIPILRDVVLVLVSAETHEAYELRMDALGTAELTVPPGAYDIGLVYKPGA